MQFSPHMGVLQGCQATVACSALPTASGLFIGALHLHPCNTVLMTGCHHVVTSTLPDLGWANGLVFWLLCLPGCRNCWPTAHELGQILRARSAS